MRQRLAPSVGFGILVSLLELPADAAFESGVYQTLAGATVEERGDRVLNGSRVVPLSAMLIFDLGAAQPTLVAVLRNAVLEGGAPFGLTLHSSSGARLADGTYSFTGDYLGDINPMGTQYLFDWRFSTAGDGSLVWNGSAFWAGGHIWLLTISNLVVVPAAWSSISRVTNGTLQITWKTNFADCVLEYAPGLPEIRWSAVTNAITTIGDRLSVTVDAGASQRFYRLRKP